MLLTTGDVIALTIALTSSLILIVSTILRNIQLTSSVSYWRDKAIKAGM